MPSARSIGRWIGCLSSAGVVAGAYAGVGLLALLDERLAQIGALIALVLVIAHVLLRPTRRGDVGRMAGLPGWSATLAHGVWGWPPWPIVAPLAVIVVVLLLVEERDEQRTTQA